MDLKQLRTLVTVAETGNVTRAAQLLNVVQPAVSRHLRLLEEEAGVLLFQRTAKGMELTAEGRTLTGYARKILHEVEKAKAEIRPACGQVSGIVTVGLMPSICGVLCNALIAEVGRRHDAIQVRIVAAEAMRLQAWVEAGEIDTAVLYDMAPAMTIRTTPLLEEDLWVVGDRQAGLRPDSPIPLAELAKRPLILPRAPRGLRHFVDHAAQASRLNLNVVAETNATNIQRILVLGGHGVTILPPVAVAEDLLRGDLTAAPLSDPPMSRKLFLAVSTTRQPSVAIRSVTEVLIACARRAVESGAWPAAHWRQD